ncbi:MAG: SIMPL domain-containing protein [Armatimonadota bacterium]
MLREGLLCRALLLALALGLVATALHAQDEDDEEKLRLLTIKADAYVEVEPEIAKISLGIEAVKPKPKEAATEVADKADAVKAKLAALGVTKESVETSELYLGEASEYDYKRHRRIRKGYRAYHWLRVTLKNEDFDKLAAVVDGAVDVGATSFGGLRFEMLDDTALQAEALAKATANARQKAEAMAEAAGARIVGVHRIEEVEPDDWAYYDVAEQADESMAPAAEPAEVEQWTEELPGKLRISCEVEVAFLLE